MSKLAVYPSDMMATYQSSSFDISPNELNTIRKTESLRFTKPGVYNFNIEQDLCFEHCDVAGNIFNVTYDGKIAAENPDVHVIEHLDHCYKNYNLTYEEVEKKHAPPIRLFIIHPDRTGTEIMRYVDCKDTLEANKTDPKMIKVEEEVEDVEDARAWVFWLLFSWTCSCPLIALFCDNNVIVTCRTITLAWVVRVGSWCDWCLEYS